MVRWLVPQHRLPAEQEPDLLRESSIAGQARCGIRTRNGFAHDQHGGRSASQAEMVEGLHQMHVDPTTASGAELIMGEGRFVAPKTVEIALDDGGTRRIFGERVFLVWVRARLCPNLPGLSAAQPMTHIEALDLDRLPEHLIVMGGGYVGLELSQAMRRFGSRVTVIEAGPNSRAVKIPTSARHSANCFTTKESRCYSEPLSHTLRDVPARRFGFT